MQNNKLKIRSTNENLRLCVIENSIFIDEFISEVIGEILNIDWRNSKSLGFESSALSFNYKIQIIQDIKSVDKSDLTKLTCIANIRNKFAHVSYINTFEDLFTKSKVGKEIKSQFINWYFDENGISDIAKSKLELVYRLCFYLLVDNVVDILLKIYENHFYEVGKKEGEKEFKDRLISSLVDYLKSQKGGDKIISNSIEEIENSFKIKLNAIK